MNENPVYSAYSPKLEMRQKDPVRLRLDKSGRKGKSVTLISDLKMHPQGKLDLLKKFKKCCGSGGTLKNGVLEIQGDHRPLIQKQLETLGYKVKNIG